MAPNKSDVTEMLRQSLNTFESEYSDLAEGVRVVVPEAEAGKLFAVLRRNSLSYEAGRDPSGDNLVANIDTEEPKGLGELFG
jgi:hypothetical protein